MNHRSIRRNREEAGVALLLAIFVLLLVAVVGIAMMAASGTETSLAVNYRSSTASYYAALSGLEEARTRLILKNPPNPLGLSGYLPLALGHAVYITNPLPTETVDPTSGTYQDNEFFQEFGYSPSSVQIVASNPSLAGSPNAFYKWVRINSVTERALKVDVNNTSGSNISWNNTRLVGFDGTNLTRVLPAPYPAFELTALAALPDGSRKLLQYIVAPITLQVPVNAAFTVTSGNLAVDAVSFTPPAGTPPPPGTTNFYINGNDQCGAKLPLPAIGVANSYDWTSINNTIGPPASPPYPHSDHFVSGSATPPSFSSVTPANSTVDLTDPISLSNFLPIVQNAADSVLNGPRTEADLPPAASVSDSAFPNNPQTVLINGDLSLTNYTGYGLLVVRGNFTYTGDSGWKGIVVVLGGTMEEVGSADGGEFDGAVILTNLGSGSLGKPTYIVGNPGGAGIHYNSCWVNTAEKAYTYKVLSFHEIPLS